MATFNTNVAINQLQNVNFPGQLGLAEMTPQPGTQNNALAEGPPEIVAIYTWLGTEAVGDVINICLLQSGWIVEHGGIVQSGATAVATTLTVQIGDNDMGLISTLPITNAAAALSQPTLIQAPTWITGTSYVAGTLSTPTVVGVAASIVLDPGSTPANAAYVCILAVSGSTQPHSDSTHWLPISERYSTSISIAGASGNVSFVPPGVYPGFNPHEIQNDCWLQALILTANVIVSGTYSMFRVGINAAN